MGVSEEGIENFQIELLAPVNMTELKHGHAEGDLFIQRGPESIIGFELLRTFVSKIFSQCLIQTNIFILAQG